MYEAEVLTGVEDMLWSGDYARAGAQAHPDRLALIVSEDGTQLSYRELDRQVCRCVAELEAEGLRPGDRVGYLGRNRALFFILLIAAMRGGFILMPMNWRCRKAEIAFFLADAEPSILFADEEFMDLAREPGAADLPIYATVAGEAADDFVLRLAADGPEVVKVVPHGDTPCMLYYTSGTSGRAKGVLLSHFGFAVMRHMEMAPPFPIWTGETSVSGMPVFHIAGTTWPMMGLMRGSTVVLTSDPSANNLIRLIREHSASRTFAVPTVIREIVKAVRASGAPLPSLKMFFYGAAPIGESLLADAIATLGCEFLQYYGMTEVSGSATFLEPRFHSLARPELMQSVGRAFPGGAIDIRHPETGRPLGRGEAGEIYVRTPTLMLGYWRSPEMTALAVQDGWYRSGDGGRLDDEGFLYLTDRIKDMIVSGGENIYPAEVEEVLRQHPAVLDAVLIAEPDERWGETAVALIELAAGHAHDEADIIAFVKSRIASYKAPKSVTVVGSLPRTASGKLQRSRARADYLAS